MQSSTTPGSFSVVDQLHDHLYNLFRPSLQSFFVSFQTNPVIATIRAIVTLVVLTRVTTTVSAWSSYAMSKDTSIPRPVPTEPYWIPFVGHWLWFAVSDQSWLRHAAKMGHKGALGLLMLGYKAIAVVDPALIRQLYETSGSKSSDDKFKATRRRRFFGYRRILVPEVSNLFEGAEAEIESRPDYLIRMARLLEQNAPNFVTGTKSLVDQEMWERGAAVEVSDDDGDMCLANLDILVRDFCLRMILTALLGAAFIQANDDFVSNLAKFSREYHRFMTGWPYWITPGLGPSAGAREKCLRALEEFVREVRTADENKSGNRATYDDLSDVNPTVWTLIQDATKVGAQPKTGLNSSDIACMLLELLWQRTWYSSSVTFWLLLRLHQQECSNDRDACREEVKVLLQVTGPRKFNSMFSEPPKLEYKDEMIRMIRHENEKMTTLDAALLEVIRLDTEVEDWYDALDNIVLTEQVGGIETKSGSKVRRHLVKKGETVYLAVGASNRDEVLWTADAGKFCPQRWLTMQSTDLENKQEDVGPVPRELAMESVRQQAQRVSTRGATLLATALLSLFEIRPARDVDNLQSRWTTIVAGARLSRRNIRVKVIRRDLERRTA